MVSLVFTSTSRNTSCRPTLKRMHDRVSFCFRPLLMASGFKSDPVAFIWRHTLVRFSLVRFSLVQNSFVLVTRNPTMVALSKTYTHESPFYT